MEILMLVLLYYLSQNPDFPESVKPLMGQLKNSEQMLGFLNDLSRFTQTFSAFKNNAPKHEEKTESGPSEKPEPDDKKEPQSPTSGIADEFIQQMLESYLKKR
ncbi:MAG: hypothetical protein IJW60_00645 [Clostridia bacterium]|nr:hypothetical protein [Clostridia bacterium]